MQYLKGALLLLIVTIASCDQTPKFDYKYEDELQTLSCEGVDNTLLNEVLHTFEADLRYGYNGYAEGKTLSTLYGQFLYTGFSGTAAYATFASPHAIELKGALIDEGIIITNGVKSNLNYNHPTVQCIIDKIEDKDLARTIKALVDTNSMDPKLFNNRMINFGLDADKNRYEALYVALDAYFQKLTTTNRVETQNE